MSCFNVKFSGQTDITFEIGRNKAYYIRYLKFSACSRCFCIYLLALDGFRFFDTWHACGFSGLQSCRQNCRNWAKLMPKSFKIHQKSIPNRPKWCSGALRKRPWEQVGPRKSILEHHQSFGGGILSPVGSFWVPFGTPLGAKCIPKSSILAPGSIKSLKNDVQEGVMEKAWKFDGTLIGKW